MVGNIGGNLGLWLGLSVLEVAKRVYKWTIDKVNWSSKKRKASQDSGQDIIMS